jgi:uncharacterized protein (DUF433 family)
MNRDTIEQFIESDPEKLGGTPVFRGTRVPVKNLFDYLEAGDGLDIFLDDFPTVSREQIVRVLEFYKVKLLEEYEIAALRMRAASLKARFS